MKKYLLISLVILLIFSGFAISKSHFFNAKVVEDMINIYSSPTDEAEINGVIPKDVKIKAMKTDGEWTKVRITGYVKTDQIKMISPIDKAKMMTSRRRVPVYPKNAAQKGKEGTVRLKVHINSSGRVSGVNIIKSSDSDSLDGVAKLTVERGWDFKTYKTDYSISLKFTFKDRDVKVEFINFSS